jgi:hypothetical protein
MEAALPGHGLARADRPNRGVLFGAGSAQLRLGPGVGPDVRRGVRRGEDVAISPTYTPELADVVLDLLIDGERGVRHLTNQGEVSWAQFGRMICAALDLDPARVRARPAASMGWSAPRPRHGALGTLHGAMMSPLGAAVERYACALRRRSPALTPLAIAAE